MRLIDADAFKENILNGLYIFCQENKEDIANAIDSEPTVETHAVKIDITEHHTFAKPDDVEGLKFGD